MHLVKLLFVLGLALAQTNSASAPVQDDQVPDDTEQDAGYEAITAKAPRLTDGLLSIGGTTPQNPFRRLSYSPQWRVLAIGKVAVPLVKPASPDNALTSLTELGKSAGNFSKEEDDANFDVNKLSFACAFEAGAELFPLPCTVRFTGFGDNILGINPVDFEDYNATAQMKEIELGFTKIRSLDFVVSKAGATGRFAAKFLLIIDNLYYTPHAKPTTTLSSSVPVKTPA